MMLINANTLFIVTIVDGTGIYDYFHGATADPWHMEYQVACGPFFLAFTLARVISE